MDSGKSVGEKEKGEAYKGSKEIWNQDGVKAEM